MNEKEVEILKPVYDGHNSFYGKAKVEIENGAKRLLSYGTHVATIYDENKAEIYGTFSMTTLRHIRDFLYQNGFELGTKREILNKYYVDKNYN